MSTAKFDTLSNLAGTRSIATDRVAQGTAAAWVNFNGTGTVAIRASFNVSSITDNGTGDYTLNFTTALPDVNYGATATAGSNNTNSVIAYEADFSVRTTSSIRYAVFAINVGVFDSNSVNVSIFR